jgi:hypothetical protein
LQSTTSARSTTFTAFGFLKLSTRLPHACVFVIATKTDLRTDVGAIARARQRFQRDLLTRDEGETFAKQHGACGYYEISALTDGEGVRRVLSEIVERSSGQVRPRPSLISNLLRRPIDPKHTHVLVKPRWPEVTLLPDALACEWHEIIKYRELSDVTMVAGEEEIPSHRLFLCMASPLLRRAFGIGSDYSPRRKGHRTHSVVKSIEPTPGRPLHWTVTLGSKVAGEQVYALMHVAVLGTMPPQVRDDGCSRDRQAVPFGRTGCRKFNRRSRSTSRNVPQLAR